MLSNHNSSGDAESDDHELTEEFASAVESMVCLSYARSHAYGLFCMHFHIQCRLERHMGHFCFNKPIPK